MNTSNPKAGQLSAKLDADRKASSQPQAPNERMMVSPRHIIRVKQSVLEHCGYQSSFERVKNKLTMAVGSRAVELSVKLPRISNGG